jgi:hypothetical protein
MGRARPGRRPCARAPRRAPRPGARRPPRASAARAPPRRCVPSESLPVAKPVKPLGPVRRASGAVDFRYDGMHDTCTSYVNVACADLRVHANPPLPFPAARPGVARGGEEEDRTATRLRRKAPRAAHRRKLAPGFAERASRSPLPSSRSGPLSRPRSAVAQFRASRSIANSDRSPIAAEALAVPADHGVGLHDDECLLPSRPKADKSAPEGAIERDSRGRRWRRA